VSDWKRRTVGVECDVFNFDLGRSAMQASNWNTMGTLGAQALKDMDRSRRARGDMLDRAGYGPQQTPSTVLYSEPGLNVRRYGEPGEPTAADAPAVLIVPAPIKRPYIWDLAPDVSVVRRWLERGYRVYLAEWVALPGRLFIDLVESLYRRDEFMQGTLDVGGRRVGPDELKTPLLSVIDPRSKLIPPAAMIPFHEATASPRKRVLHYEGDVGVNLQHVGVLVGRSAHARIWPAIFDWLDGRD
jgi:poly(3-hydroxyalkanoate) synthetase